MKPNLTRLTPFFFLALAISPYLYYGIQQYRQQSIRHEMKEELEESFLQTIVIHEKDVKWVKAGKEVWINGKMFDIKSLIQENQTYTFTGLFDEEETALVKNMEREQQKQKANGSVLLAQLFQIFRADHMKDSDELLLPETIITVSPQMVINIPSPCHAILTPPPRC